MAFVAETQAKIRERIGRLMYGPRYLKDTVATVGSTYVTTLKATRFSADHFSGAVLYVVNGAAAGSSTYVSTSEPGSGKLTLSPVPLVMPSVGDQIEVWPNETTPEDVNESIALAMLDVQNISAAITVLTSPTIDTARKRVTIPATWSMVARLSFEYGGLKYVLRPRDPRDPQPWDQEWPTTFDIEATNRQIVILGGIPATATNVRLVGYALPTLPAADTDTVPMRSDFLTYKAAAILLQNRMATSELDPEGSGSKVQFWTTQAEAIKRQMQGQAMSNTARIEEAV
jgi:hypothetical protein